MSMSEAPPSNTTIVELSNESSEESSSSQKWRDSVAMVQKYQGVSDCFKTLRDMNWDVVIPQEKIEITKKLGTGQFGTVYLCSYQGKTVAAKFLKQQFANTNDEECFLKELQLLKKLRNPNIVAYIGTGHKNIDGAQQIFLAQECIDGGSLQNILFKQQISFGKQLYSTLDAYNWVLDIAKGLQYLHNSSPMVIHRDLKLENVLLAKKQQRTKAIIVDFGLHTLINEHSTKKKGVYELTGKTGSYVYMAPEVFLKDKYNEKVDVFSFGIITWELFSQSMVSIKVAPNGNPQEVIDYAAESAFGKRQAVPESWPQELQDLVQMCWHQDPNLRPSMDNICQKLQDMHTDIVSWHQQSSNKHGCCTIM